jgi:tRNA-modifying protein YgfZ
MATDHNQAMMSSPIAHEPPHGATRLADWGVIRAAGVEARKFLHSQLTQDFEQLSPDHARLAGYCSAKGRLLATFVAWQRGPDEVLLACSADLLATTLKRLSMFVLRARCKLSDASAEVPLWGLAGGSALCVLGDAVPAAAWGRGVVGAADVIRLPDAPAVQALVPRFLWAGEPPPALPPLAASVWQWLEVMSGVARVVGATVEQFVPQMVNLDLVGGVSFQKGCYPGQEVVARSHYRGTIKRRSNIVLGTQAMHPGQEIFSSDDPAQPAGMVVLAGSLDGARHAALAELKLASLAAATLHVDSANGPLLTPAPLPYALPAETEAA